MKSKRYHIIIDLSDVSNKVLNDENGLKGYLAELPGKIGMHILFGPTVVSGIPENPGLSGFVIIDYSHISIHTFTDHREALVDIFSCKPFEKQDAIQSALNYFSVPETQARIKEVYWG